jgi:uncharacterized protein YjbI with pentapeptide repeats
LEKHMPDLTTNEKLQPILTADEKAALRGQAFVSRELVEMDLSGADLRGARFEKTMVTRCSLVGADLRGATFRLCELRGVDLAEAVFGDNRFDGTTFVDVTGLTTATTALIENCGGTFQPVYASHR